MTGVYFLDGKYQTCLIHLQSFEGEMMWSPRKYNSLHSDNTDALGRIKRIRKDRQDFGIIAVIIIFIVSLDRLLGVIKAEAATKQA